MERTILIVDDDKEIAEAIAFYLRSEGYKPVIALDGVEAINLMRSGNISLIIMDVMMPGLDGIQTTMRIREEHNIPIIMLSAKSEDYDKITGLNVGADDYMTKPFNPLELIARVRSQLRRYNQLGSSAEAVQSNVFRSGGLEIDDEARHVTVDGEEVSLTPIEYRILKLLTANAGRVYSIEQIYEKVWKEDAYNPENTVAVHIRRIREKIEIDPKNPRYLKVVWGVGYKVEKQ
jgi:DNA-binding response OmpR family regulator